LIHAGIVRTSVTDEEVRIDLEREIGKYVTQTRCVEFGGSTGARRILGQSYLLALIHVGFTSSVIRYS
jgi:hypothetical protein